MSTSRSILVLGLGPYAKLVKSPPHMGAPPAAGDNKEKVEREVSKAKDMGFECTTMHVNPTDISGTMASVQQQLRSREWSGIVIGYGVRGLPDCTELFEKLVNMCTEETWGKGCGSGSKLMFSTAPDKIVEAIQRVFLEVAQEEAHA
jgi:hypothetical protein